MAIKNKMPPFKFAPFSKKQLKLLTWWQDNSPVSDKFMVVADGSIRSGKCQYINQYVYTPNGKTHIGDIKVGDYVIDRLGNPTKVLGVYPQGEKECYRITFHDGSSTICSKSHLWSYTTKKCVSNGNLTVYTSTLEDIMKELDKFKDRKTMHERACRFRFPLAKCVKFKSREVKIDPYLLGLLLGDGCFSESNSGIIFTNAEDELHEYIKNILPIYDMSYIYVPKNNTHCAYGRLQNKCGVHGKLPLRKLLEEYGLFGKKSAEKFVPEDYKYNSEEVRLNILAGLLNTDGSVHIKNRPSIEFYSNSKQLVDDVAEIARSLGLFCNTDVEVDTHKANPHYRCTILVKEKLYILLSEKHKSRLNLNSTKDKKWRLIKSIEYVGKKECQCIYVDNQEHLYLTDDFIVTHNTVSCILSFVMYVMTHFNYQNSAIAGKSLNVDSEIPTPNGIKKLKDIQIGDYVYNRKGKAVKVLGVFPQGKLDSYNITFNDGTKVNCSADQLWSYYSGGNFNTSTLKDMMKNNYEDYLFPLNEEIECNNLKEKYEKLSNYINNYDDELYELQDDKRKGLYLGFKYSKYISYLARSLGIFVDTTYKDKMFIFPNIKLYSLLNSSKKELLDISSDKYYRKIKSIEYVGKTEQKCLYVDDDEHLFLVNDFIVTHNTVLSVRRNIVQPLKQIAQNINVEVIEHRSENYLELIKGDIVNYVYLFGGKISLLPR